MRLFGHALLILALTLLTQLGGLAWLAALRFRHKLMAFSLFYLLLFGGAMVVAPMTGRVALPCTGGNFHMQSPLYCLMNRHYVTPEMASVARDAADQMSRDFPGTITLALDGNFPFLTGFPLIPHLSHSDGRKLDLAFYYRTPAGTYYPAKTRSPIGYWAFEGEAPSQCPPVWLTFRWGMDWLQPLWPDRPMDAARTAALVNQLAQDGRVSKLFVEPELVQSLDIANPKLRFQGCRAARHDDHIHLQM